jgi:hypothetical protein
VKKAMGWRFSRRLIYCGSAIVTDRLNILLLAKEKPKEKNTHVCI